MKKLNVNTLFNVSPSYYSLSPPSQSASIPSLLSHSFSEVNLPPPSLSFSQVLTPIVTLSIGSGDVYSPGFGIHALSRGLAVTFTCPLCNTGVITSFPVRPAF